MFSRVLAPPKKSFFLFGPRATGKSTWLKTVFPDAHRIDLLNNATYFQLTGKPGLFRELVLGQPKGRWIIVDEVQRIPELLNDVHSLIEDEGRKFALTGSSARKLKRGKANLLAGRALVRGFFPLIHAEFGESFRIEGVLRWGCLPGVMSDEESRVDTLEAYAGTYLREEIKEEALTRNVQAFSRFLDVAALANAQVTNLANISRDAQVGRPSVDTYFSILQDTLIGAFLPAWTPRARIKEVSHPKFYFFDCGVLRAIQGRLRDRPTEEERGLLLETYLFHELRAHISYASVGGELSYWRTPDGIEIDFIWRRGEKRVGLEIKASTRWRSEYDKGFEAILDSKFPPQRCFGVYLGQDRLRKPWGHVLPLQDFLRQLDAGKILG